MMKDIRKPDKAPFENMCRVGVEQSRVSFYLLNGPTFGRAWGHESYSALLYSYATCISKRGPMYSTEHRSIRYTLCVGC